MAAVDVENVFWSEEIMQKTCFDVSPAMLGVVHGLRGLVESRKVFLLIVGFIEVVQRIE
jgi:hypothetical protein